MSVRVAIIDSGVNPDHPHAGNICGGVSVILDGDGADYIDRIGHGTAVAGVIHEKAPLAEIHAVRIFERRLTTTLETLLRGLDWCLNHGMRIVNLSLGTANEQHRGRLEDYLRRAADNGTLVISAAGTLPGELAGAIAVAADITCERNSIRWESGNRFFASPYPRSIPGVPPEKNLHGVSFAVANCTGLLAHAMESLSPHEALQELQRMASRSNSFRR